jgi:hypothetical protein
VLTCASFPKARNVNDECRLLGYKNSVGTSQETRNVSTTEYSQLMLCKI